MVDFEYRKPRNIGEILTDTFQYIRLNYKTLGKGLLFFVAPFYIVQVALIGNENLNFFQAIGNPELEAQATSTIFSGKYLLSLLMSVLGTTMLSVITLKHLQLTSLSREADPSNLLENVVTNALRLIVLYIVLAFSLFFASLIFLIPAIFIGIQWSLAPTALIIEEKNIFSSMGRSWELVKDYWWVTFGLFILMYIISFFSTLIFMIPTSILSVFISSIGADASAGIISLLNTFFLGVMTVLSSMLYCIMYIAFSLHYFNLVERKEGVSLRSRIENLSL